MVVGAAPGPGPVTTLVTGAGGQLGRSTVRAFMNFDKVVGLARADLDVTDRDGVHAAVAAHRPSVVVNCAGWTDVDGCELDPELAHLANAQAPGFLREACEEVDAHLVHISTDFVFDGARDEPYSENCSTGPLNVYGATKLEGESAAGPLATVVRTSWLQDSAGPNMVDRVLDGLAGVGELTFPGDRQSTPSFSDDVARVVRRLAAERHPGVVHAANGGVTSWADFARLVANEVGDDAERIQATSEADYDTPRPAHRPRYSALDNTVLRDLGRSPMRHHRDVVIEILDRLRAG